MGKGEDGEPPDHITSLSPVKAKGKEGIGKYNHRLQCISKKVPARLMVESPQTTVACQRNPAFHGKSLHQNPEYTTEE